MKIELIVKKKRIEEEERECWRKGFKIGREGKWGDEDEEILSMKKGIEDGEFMVEKEIVIKIKGIWIDRIEEREKKEKSRKRWEG